MIIDGLILREIENNESNGYATIRSYSIYNMSVNIIPLKSNWYDLLLKYKKLNINEIISVDDGVLNTYTSAYQYHIIYIKAIKRNSTKLIAHIDNNSGVVFNVDGTIEILSIQEIIKNEQEYFNISIDDSGNIVDLANRELYNKYYVDAVKKILEFNKIMTMVDKSQYRFLIKHDSIILHKIESSNNYKDIIIPDFVSEVDISNDDHNASYNTKYKSIEGVLIRSISLYNINNLHITEHHIIDPGAIYYIEVANKMVVDTPYIMGGIASNSNISKLILGRHVKRLNTKSLFKCTIFELDMRESSIKELVNNELYKCTIQSLYLPNKLEKLSINDTLKLNYIQILYVPETLKIIECSSSIMNDFIKQLHRIRLISNLSKDDIKRIIKVIR